MQSFKFKGFREEVKVGDVYTVGLDNNYDGKPYTKGTAKVVGFNEYLEEPTIEFEIVDNDGDERYRVGEKIELSVQDIVE